MTGPWNFSDEPPPSHEEEWLQPWEEAEPAPWEWDEDMESLAGPEYDAWKHELEEDDGET